MIAFLNGKIIHIDFNFCILEINGVGYEIFLPTRTLQTLTLGENRQFYIYTHVREDQLKLFGFEYLQERKLFTLMLDVSGVGPKAALSILSFADLANIEKAISQADVNFFTKIKGLGKKTAQKIIIELKSKIGSTKELDLNAESNGYNEDVVFALQSFGFLKKDIMPVLEKIDQGLSEDQQLKIALQQLGKI
ncbi:Holliday junction branch migration protein RuvA [Candidatus Beckwithbacteria bacterium]|nr:Holliday junction branch migration protein RuvA [Candidatus Beckwithbacteria bacterium]